MLIVNFRAAIKEIMQKIIVKVTGNEKSTLENA